MHRTTLYMTSTLEGIGGQIKTEPEDFIVDEIPAYAPSGEGPHLYIQVEKRDISAIYALKQLSQAFDVAKSAIGQAGNKDRRAVTRQWFSVLDEKHRWDPEAVELETLDIGEGMKVLAMSRHGNKLKTGHLWGNRFQVRLRGAATGGAAVAQEVLEVLAKRGLPNFYGAQRFGRGGVNITRGLELLGGKRSRRGRFDRRMVVSALQSWLFNRALAQRMGRGSIHQVLLGDVCATATGGLFEVEDVEVDQPRLDAGEIVHTGPMFGHRMWSASGDAGALEQEVLDEQGLTLEAFKVFGKLARGTRRHNLIFLRDPEVDEDDLGIVLRFSLPKGCYATVLLDEVTKLSGPVLDPTPTDGL